MKKRLLIITLAMVGIYGNLGANQGNSYMWNEGKFSLIINLNSAESLNEKILNKSYLDKGYALFKLLRKNVSDKKIIIDLNSDNPYIKNPSKNMKIFKELNFDEIKKVLNIKFEGKERYAPEYIEGAMHNIMVNDGAYEMEVGGISIFQNSNPIEFIGRRKENIIIRVNGQLMFLSEVSWQPVISLESYYADQISWIDDDNISAIIQDKNSETYSIAVASVRKPIIKTRPLPAGNYRSHAADQNSLFCHTDIDGVNVIWGYNEELELWERINFTKEPVILLGIRKGKLLWLESSKIISSTGYSLKNLSKKTIELYPYGECEIYNRNVPIDDIYAYKLTVVFFDDENTNKIRKLGINNIDMFSTNETVWVMNKSYRHNFDRFHEKAGSINLAEIYENRIKIYYDSDSISGFRTINNTYLLPSVSGKTVIIILTILLIMLLLGEVFNKTKGYLK